MTDSNPDNKEPKPVREPVEVYPGIRRYQFLSKAKHRMLTPHLNRIAMVIIAASLLIVIVKALIIGSASSLFCLEDRACSRVNKTDDPSKRCPEMLEPAELVVSSRVNDYVRFIKAGGLRCRGCGNCVQFCILALDIPKIVSDMQERTLAAMERDKVPRDVLEKAFFDPRLERNQTREEAANKDIFDRVQAYLERHKSGAPRTEREQTLALCQRCHAGADESLLTATRYVHFDMKDLDPHEWTARMAWIIRLIYILLIVATIGAMLGHNLLDLARTIRRHTAPGGDEATVERFGVVWRAQHAALLVCFACLAMSGLAMLFHRHWPAPVVIRLFGGTSWAASLHVAAGLALVALGGVHVLCLALSGRFRRDMRGVFPRLGDVRDVFTQMAFYLGLRAEPARFGRYGYREKAEYWALVWGVAIMGASGGVLVLARAGAHVPGWLVVAARVVHGYEAILAVLAILVWHVYNVHLSPRRFPGSMTWITGRISAGEMAEDHPLEWEEMKAVEDAPE